MVTGNDDDTAIVWDAATGELLHRVGPGWRVMSVAFSPDGSQAVTASEGGTIRFWALDTGQLLRSIHTSIKMRSFTFSPDGKYVVTSSQDNTVRFWDVASDQPPVNWPQPQFWGGAESVVFTPDGKTVYGAQSGISVWAVPAGQLTFYRFSGFQCLSIAVSPNGKQLLVGGIVTDAGTTEPQHIAQLWDETGIASRTPLRTFAFPGPRDWSWSVRAVYFAPGGQPVLTATGDYGAHLWNTPGSSLFVAISQAGSNLVVTWDEGVLQEAEQLDGSWRDLNDAASPYQVNPGLGSRFYRVRTAP